MISRETLTDIYRRLFEAFGPQHWWPGETRFEIIVGAILTQNTSWANVAKAIANLKDAECLQPDRLHALDPAELERLIRPAGYFRLKAKRLRHFTQWLFDTYEGRLDALDAVETHRLREELLGISGIGPETADSILLYALDRPVFVVDTYTARVAVRHGLIEPDVDYTQLQYLFESNLEPDVRLFNEFHALLVRVGKDFCKPKPRCEACPLNDLPHTVEVRCDY
ncbi:MAG TPA: endonuclease III domain-containing protein [Sedimentisphaerales bacterium]|nr:endonuclease III domain-containing protein [Sedimentisphaerales bacterium]HRS10709.1 endonuclease III domain-containing protein [Sedimentisphaerales bacterium]HRV47414.1 endonuclease III domain-containing protein [Sedimentisphaerales bacterium]